MAILSRYALSAASTPTCHRHYAASFLPFDALDQFPKWLTVVIPPWVACRYLGTGLQAFLLAAAVVRIVPSACRISIARFCAIQQNAISLEGFK